MKIYVWISLKLKLNVQKELGRGGMFLQENSIFIFPAYKTTFFTFLFYSDSLNIILYNQIHANLSYSKFS